MLVQIMQILQVQEKALQLGIATPKNINESCIELTKNAGFKDGDKYWTNPSEKQQQPQQPDPKTLEAQAKAQQAQAQMQFDTQKALADHQAKQEQMNIDAQYKAQQIELQRTKQEQDFYISMQTLVAKQQEASDKQQADMVRLMEEVKLENSKLLAKIYNDTSMSNTEINGGI
jgi:hypothetical protein